MTATFFGPPMFTGPEIVETLEQLGITHVVWVPDSTLGRWEADLRGAASLRLISVCREGEAWAVAAGLHLGGARPLVMIQCTGLFESGDSLRNVLHDYRLPLFAIIGYRSYLNESTLPGDTAKVYSEPLLRAWDIDYLLIVEPSQRGEIAGHYEACRAAGKPGAILLAEGRA
jgi:sulfopyruvate decarboxylase subunit alpha